MAYLNLRSIFKCFKKFADMVKFNEFGAVAKTETWLKVSLNTFIIQVHTFFRCDRHDARGGGVGIYVSNKYQDVFVVTSGWIFGIT